MKKNRFSEEQIIRILNEAQQGGKEILELSRHHHKEIENSRSLMALFHQRSIGCCHSFIFDCVLGCAWGKLLESRFFSGQFGEFCAAPKPGLT